VDDSNGLHFERPGLSLTIMVPGMSRFSWNEPIFSHDNRSAHPGFTDNLLRQPPVEREVKSKLKALKD